MSVVIQQRLPLLYKLFMKIAEPRTRRVVHFVGYIALFIAGVGTFLDTPSSFVGVLGVVLSNMFGIFLLAGGLMGFVAVLPGVWWLERAAIFALAAAVLTYIVILANLPSASLVAIGFSGFVLSALILRWTEIRGAYLAPILPRTRKD